MIKLNKYVFLLVFFSLMVPKQQLQSESNDNPIDLSLKKEIEHSIVKGLKWLSTKQEKNGSWQDYPAISALVLSSFLRSHPNISVEDSIIAAGFNFLKNCIQKNGGIYIDDMQTYNTAICIKAFEDARRMEFSEIILSKRLYAIHMSNNTENYPPYFEQIFCFKTF